MRRGEWCATDARLRPLGRGSLGEGERTTPMVQLCTAAQHRLAELRRLDNYRLADPFSALTVPDRRTRLALRRSAVPDFRLRLKRHTERTLRVRKLACGEQRPLDAPHTSSLGCAWFSATPRTARTNASRSKPRLRRAAHRRKAMVERPPAR